VVRQFAAGSAAWTDCTAIFLGACTRPRLLPPQWPASLCSSGAIGWLLFRRGHLSIPSFRSFAFALDDRTSHCRANFVAECELERFHSFPVTACFAKFVAGSS